MGITRYSYKTVPTIRRFSNSNKFIRGLMGPVGSGKSAGCSVEIMNRAQEQNKGPDGLRKTRWIVTRDTYGQLRDTTIKTFHDWFPPVSWGRYRENPYPDYLITKGKDLHCEILFRALDRPEHIENLLSLELTGAWINEARTTPKEVINILTTRVGRYPAQKDGGCTWHGIFMDTNPPDDDSWWYKLFEIDRPENVELFKQPSGLSPEAENVPHLIPGYYENLVIGQDPEWIKVYVHGQYGTLKEGVPVYPEYRDDLHCVYDLEPMEGIPLILGWDYGLTPACVVCQVTPAGQFRVLFEMVTYDIGGMGIRQFSEEVVIPTLEEKYGPWVRDRLITQSWGDPSNTRSQNDEITPTMILNGDTFDQKQAVPTSLGVKLGIYTDSARTNDLQPRLDAVKRLLPRWVDQERDIPSFAISHKCQVLRKGFMSGYHFAKVRTVGEDRYQDKPKKNKFSHPHDGLQYAAMMAFDGVYSGHVGSYAQEYQAALAQAFR